MSCNFRFDEKKITPSHLIKNTRNNPSFGKHYILTDFDSNKLKKKVEIVLASKSMKKINKYIFGHV
jgi:hypothetical protein